MLWCGIWGGGEGFCVGVNWPGCWGVVCRGEGLCIGVHWVTCSGVVCGREVGLYVGV